MTRQPDEGPEARETEARDPETRETETRGTETREAAALSPSDPRQVGRYRLVGRLGSGGMGTVYLAEDPSGQRVAVKLVRPELARIPEFRARFKREADSARRVARFCTAAVLDVDVAAEVPYLVTEFVDGPTLAEAVGRRGPLSPAELHQLAASMASALMAIHRAGLVHRDLKPSNILLSRLGPIVIDFGIARALDAASALSGDARLGTPAFMAPEQARGEPVTPATDVFAWGGVLVYAGTGRFPFGTGPSPALLFRTVNEPPDLEGFEPSLRPLVEDAMRKNPAERPTPEQLYSRLLGLTSDTVSGVTRLPLSEVTALIRPITEPPSPPSPPPSPPRQHLDYLETVVAPDRSADREARPPEPGPDPSPQTRERTAEQRRSRRTALLLAGVLTAVVALTALAIVLTGGDGRRRPPTQVPEQVAERALRIGDEELARRLALAAYQAAPDTPATRAAMIAMFGADTVPATLEVRERILTAMVHPDGRHLALGTDGGTVQIWDVSDPARPALTNTLAGHGDWVYSLAFNQAGTILAAGLGDGAVRIWDVSDLRAPRGMSTITFHRDRVRSLAISPDGNTLASGGEDGVIALWAITDPSRPVERSHADGRTGGVRSITFAPTGALLAFGGVDGTVRLWDVVDAAHPRETAVLRGHNRTVQSVAFAADGSVIASGGVDGTIRIWAANTADTAAPAVVSGHVASVTSVAFSPDSGVVASASEDETIRLTGLTDPAQPLALAELHGHTRAVSAVFFTSDGNTVVSAGTDGTVRLWNLDPARLRGEACADPDNRISPVEWDEHFGRLPYQAPCG